MNTQYCAIRLDSIGLPNVFGFETEEDARAWIHTDYQQCLITEQINNPTYLARFYINEHYAKIVWTDETYCEWFVAKVE